MRSMGKFLVVILLALVLGAVECGSADAARFGGGRSFGGSRSFSKSYSKPVTPQRQTGTGMAAPSRLGGMGGIFGGLLAGTLLGSMFFGHPFAGGGMMDILLIGGLLFLLLRMFGKRRPAQQAAGRSGGMGYGGAGPDLASGPMTRDAGAGWSGLRAQPAPGAGPEITLPPGFDEAEFLAGAKAAFTRLQASWDTRDLDDIRQFTSDAVFDEIKAQAQTDPGPSQTDVIMVEARLLEARIQGQATLATVIFDALLREDRAAGAAGQVREVWHFKREAGFAEGAWHLDGIQQLEQ